MDILIATDASWVVDDITAHLVPTSQLYVCQRRAGGAREVEKNTPDLAILDMQIGSMGGMAVTMSLRLDESSGLLRMSRC